MSKPEQTQRFTEIEYCLQSYFRTHIQPVMQRTRNELNKRQAEEVRDYQLSTGGLLRSFANAMNNIPDDTMTYLRHTGEWNSKTAEDYVVPQRYIQVTTAAKGSGTSRRRMAQDRREGNRQAEV